MDDKLTLKGAWSGSRLRFNFDACNHITGTAEARVAKFCTEVEYIKRWPCDRVKAYPLMGLARVM